VSTPSDARGSVGEGVNEGVGSGEVSGEGTD
jgi:hypothetical protein